MGRTRNKTRQTLTPVSIQKPVKDGIQLRDWLFVSLENWYIIPATPSTVIEGCCVNDIFNHEETKEPEDGSHRACIYFPKRHWESFTIEVENGEITQEDVGQTFLIIGDLQHINYETKAELGWQFRLERVITPTKWEFTYYFESALSPQWPKGKDGETPTFTFKPVVTLPVWEEAWMDVEKDWNNYELTFKIPQGANWKSGDDGTPGWKWNPGDTIDIKIGTVADGTNASATITPAGKLVRDLNLVIPKGKDWEDGLTPTPKHEWSPAREYQYIDIVRHPDTDWVGSSWIRTNKDRPATSADEPGESPYWMLLVKDWADGEPWPEWGTVVIPVEWKPGKDWVGTPWKDWKDWKTWHNEWDFSPTWSYPPLSTVRAFTWEYDEYWNPIYARYWTNNWASDGTEPRDSSKWQLIVKDWSAWNWNIRSAMVFMSNDSSKTWNFDSDWNGVPTQAKFDKYTWNKDMATSWWTWITITKTWHYRIYWHAIVQNNTGSNMYINLWRLGIHLTPGSGSWRSETWLATAKQWWAYATKQWPWLDLTVDCTVDLYEWDTLTMYYRPQTDTAWAEQQPYAFQFKWALDASWSVQTYLGWLFSTYLWAEWISKISWQAQSSWKIVWAI